ncbi:MAG TPA: rhodanese-like domain-containing protein [Acidimicrobiia bacterium]|jgi:rhodanese-related sulfurtransferase/glyoxylase-like metal-dependent hydrolase (beta-lactamase superfamily II)|nr:rhodanese-like domain-containing protein [Acidimicrobiia bacterium]
MDVRSIRTASLGDATYIASHNGYAIVVDPQRDLGRFTEVIEAEGLTVTHVLETHIHNDYISGGRALAAQTGADLVIPAAAGATFPFVPAFHNEALAAEAGLVIRPWHTPGHTLAHTSYVVLVDGVPEAVFTGGSLLVGAAGRSDLLGVDLAHQLAVLQFGSLQRLATLPDATGVYPTHGEGSFCTASGAGRTTSTIGQEKAENPLYEFTEADAFAANQLAGLVPYPTYYAHMGPANRGGPTALATPTVPELSADAVAALIEAGATVLDGRERHAFAAAHVPGSIGIELGTSFAPWSGWLLEYNTPTVLVLDPGQDAVEAATELGRIGFERIEGVMRGTAEWMAGGRDVASFETADIQRLVTEMNADRELQVIDVRDPMEWAAGHLEGSTHTYVPDLPGAALENVDASRPVWLVCRTGNRATIAAGLLERMHLTPVVVTKGGVPDALAGT